MPGYGVHLRVRGNANNAESIVIGAKHGHHGRTVLAITAVDPTEDTSLSTYQVLVCQIPALFNVDDIHISTATAGKAPSSNCMNPVRSRFEVLL
jgi:hypothetical protein